ncbi:hypothetical protein C8R44DRAFT_895968 [Mycena epipterygia]|nr:hypothetical protein C8R44DRAFT_895968 [Mycena epipterygia]
MLCMALNLSPGSTSATQTRAMFCSPWHVQLPRPNHEALITSISLCGVLFRDPPSPMPLNKGWYLFAPW